MSSPSTPTIKLISRDILFVVRLSIGFIFVVVGFIDLFIPFLPDILLIAIGLLFFDVNGKIAKYIIKFLPRPMREQMSEFSLKIEAKIDSILGKWR